MQFRRTWILLLVAVAVGAGVALRERTPAAPAGFAGASPRESRPAIGAPPEKRAPPAPNESFASRALDPLGSAGVRSLQQEPGGDELGSGEQCIEIVYEGSDLPVPDAEVAWLPAPPDCFDSGAWMRWIREGRVEQTMASAQRTRSNALGVVRLPRHPGGLVVAASRDEWWGMRAFDPDEASPAELSLSTDYSVQVQVVDQRGEPVVGAPVVLRQWRGRQYSDRLGVRTTAPDGLAVLHHAGHLMGGSIDPDQDYCVAWDALFDPPIETRLSDASMARRVLVLQAPPSGSCVVSLVDHLGQERSLLFEAQLEFYAEPKAGRPRASTRAPLRLSEHGRGQVEFECVELGRTLFVQVRLEGVDTRFHARAIGPSRPGERVEVPISVDKKLALLRGWIADARGAPLAVRTIVARVHPRQDGSESPKPWFLYADAEGLFELPLEPWLEVPEGAFLELTAAMGDGAALGIGRRYLPAALGQGLHELGQIRLTSPALFASGTVVDESGKGCADAVITVLEFEPSWSFLDSAQHSTEPPLPVRSDVRGRFQLQGRLAADTAWVQAERPGLRSDPQLVRAGSSQVQLVLRPTGSLAGEVQLHASLRDVPVFVRVTPAQPGSQRPSLDSTTLLSREGRFEFRELPPGAYTLEVAFAFDGQQLARVEGLEVLIGPATRDPRIDPLDLREQWSALRFDLLDESGLPVAGEWCTSRPTGAPQAPWTRASRQGTSFLVIGNGQRVDLEFFAEGFLRERLHEVAESRQVILRACPRLRFELGPGLSLPAAPVRVGLELTPLLASEGEGLVKPLRWSFDDSGQIRCASPCSGPLQAHVFVAWSDPGRYARVPVDGQQQVFEVARSAREQVFSLKVDAAALSAAIERLVAEL